uniref:C-JID domain-containing protein n=1 Tax=Populus alba TaxID=43335 RepID=A0A4U5QZ16_POPAL|nr:hypothetical protein D5086_0000023380 [Populus alba]
MSMFPRHIHLKSDAFAMMDGLRFLNFYGRCYSQEDKMHLPLTGLKYLPSELRYLRWDGFPSKSLPPSFRAEHLVELNLRGSKLVRLWTAVKDVGNLRTIDLSDSPYLTELPDLSMAKNLVSLILVGCPSLTEVPSSLQYLDKLEEIDLRGCYNLRSFPMLDSKVLRILSIGGCLDMTTCPTISQNLERLCLAETSIKEVPQSVTSKLEYLSLNGCSKMTKFPEISGDIKVLCLSGTAIKETLELDGTPIKVLPELPSLLMFLKTHDCASLETAISIFNIKSLMTPSDFTNCFKLDQKQLIEAMHLKIQSGEVIPIGMMQMVLPGSEIPEWFGDKGIGSSLTIQLPSNCRHLMGIAFCLVFLLPPPSQDMPYEVNDDINVKLYLDYHVKSKNSEHDGDDEVVLASQKSLQAFPSYLRTCDSDHMILDYSRGLGNHLRKYSGNEVTFKFYHLVDIKGIKNEGHEIRRPFELKSCGVMDSELQLQMVGIHALQQLAAPGFEHLKIKVM